MSDLGMLWPFYPPAILFRARFVSSWMFIHPLLLTLEVLHLTVLLCTFNFYSLS